MVGTGLQNQKSGKSQGNKTRYSNRNEGQMGTFKFPGTAMPPNPQCPQSRVDPQRLRQKDIKEKVSFFPLGVPH